MPILRISNSNPKIPPSEGEPSSTMVSRPSMLTIDPHNEHQNTMSPTPKEQRVVPPALDDPRINPLTQNPSRKFPISERIPSYRLSKAPKGHPTSIRKDGVQTIETPVTIARDWRNQQTILAKQLRMERFFQPHRLKAFRTQRLVAENAKTFVKSSLGSTPSWQRQNKGCNG